MSKRRSDDDDLGFRTPTKRTKKRSRPKDEEGSEKREGARKRKSGEAERPRRRKSGEAERPSRSKSKTGEHERPRESKSKTGKVERPRESKSKTGKVERPRESKSKTGEHERPSEKSKTGKQPAVAEASKSSSDDTGGGNKVLLGAAGLGVALVGGLAIMLLTAEPPKPKPPPKIAQIVPEPVAPTGQPAPPPVQVAGPKPIKLAKPPPVAPKPTVAAATPTPTPKPALRAGKTLEELAKRSATHAAVARVLEEHMAIFDPAALRSPGPNREPFHERRRREEELLQQLRGMGPLAVDALKEMLIELNNRHQQIFLGKALAGIDGPEASAAVVEVLTSVKDMSIQLSVTRSLPETPDSAALLTTAFSSEADANLRSMLMREYNRRLESTDPGELFRQAALDPDQRVRAEAVSILGRRRRPEDAPLLEDIIRKEEDPNIRKRAIVSYAQTGGSTSLGYLQNLARDPTSAADVRASAVLGISLVGGQEAIAILEQVATTDADPNVKTRAERAANNLRRNMQRAQSQEEVEAPPVQIGPQAEPLERR